MSRAVLVISAALMLSACPGNEETMFRANNGDSSVVDVALADVGVPFSDAAFPVDGAGSDAVVDAQVSGYQGPIAIAGIEALRDNLAPPTADVDSATYASTNDLAPTGFLRARVRTSFASAWNAMISPQTFRDPRTINRISVLQFGNQPSFPVSFRTKHYVGGQLIEVTFDITTVAARDTVSGTNVAIMRWQKTSGTSAISRLEASATLRELPGTGLVELEIMQRLAAPGQNENTVRDALRVMFERFLNTVRGNPPSNADCNPCMAVPAEYLMQ